MKENKMYNVQRKKNILRFPLYSIKIINLSKNSIKSKNEEFFIYNYLLKVNENKDLNNLRIIICIKYGRIKF